MESEPATPVRPRLTLRRNTPRSKATLTARPHAPEQPVALAKPGKYRLELSHDFRDGSLVVPAGDPAEPRPLLVLLHGAGSDGNNMLHLVGNSVTAANCLLLAPDARKHTWDFLLDDFGPDVRFLDRALAQTFARCRVDPSRIALAGFSDGASYALTMGLANGDLFTHILAFSPGFIRTPELRGAPRIFVSHGTQDEVLPIDLCSRRLVPILDELGYAPVYREFNGPHTVPPPVLAEALRGFLDQEA